MNPKLKPLNHKQSPTNANFKQLSILSFNSRFKEHLWETNLNPFRSIENLKKTHSISAKANTNNNPTTYSCSLDKDANENATNINKEGGNVRLI